YAQLTCSSRIFFFFFFKQKTAYEIGEQVEITAPGLVVEVLHVPLDDHQRILIEREDRGIAVLLPHREHLLPARSGVGVRLVVVRRHDRAGSCGRGHGRQSSVVVQFRYPKPHAIGCKLGGAGLGLRPLAYGLWPMAYVSIATSSSRRLHGSTWF